MSYDFKDRDGDKWYRNPDTGRFVFAPNQAAANHLFANYPPHGQSRDSVASAFGPLSPNPKKTSLPSSPDITLSPSEAASVFRLLWSGCASDTVNRLSLTPLMQRLRPADDSDLPSSRRFASLARLTDLS